MNDELREAIGKALFEEFANPQTVPWEEQTKATKEVYMNGAERVVSTFLLHVREGYGKEGKKE